MPVIIVQSQRKNLHISTNFGKLPNIKFHENLFSRSRVMCAQTEGWRYFLQGLCRGADGPKTASDCHVISNVTQCTKLTPLNDLLDITCTYFIRPARDSLLAVINFDHNFVNTWTNLTRSEQTGYSFKLKILWQNYRDIKQEQYYLNRYLFIYRPYTCKSSFINEITYRRLKHSIWLQ